MDTMSSVEFRKQYASLKQATIVTVNGHPIGVWMPGVVDYHGVSSALSVEADRSGAAEVSITEPSFNSRPFTPVPKRR